MDEQRNVGVKPIDPKSLSIWIGVTILILVGIGVVALIMYMAAHPQATFLIGGM